MNHQAHRSNGPSELTVVVVTYNEEDRIRACLESIFSACRGLAEFEVVLVDSNSTDRTVEFAAEFPITILRIPDDDLTTPGAGRYVGTAAAQGEMVLYVDGDMVIQRKWLKRAIAVLSSRTGVAGIDGHLDAPSDSDTIIETDSVRGVALYSQNALQSVGGFDPYLQSIEDIHLGYQMTAGGYTLLRLPEMAATHPSRSSISEPFRRLRRGYTIGSGQVLRRSLGSPRLFAKHLYRIRHRLILFAWLSLGVASFASSAVREIWLGLSVVAVGFLLVKLGPGGTVGFLLAKLFGFIGLVRGLFVPPRPPESFPLEKVEVLQNESDFKTTASSRATEPPAR